MEVIKWKDTRVQFKRIMSVLKKGGVIVYPTETAYGLGADPRNKRAIEMVYKINYLKMFVS